MYRYLKGIRVTLSLIFFLGITTVFLDFTGFFPNSFFHGITYLQFVPSLIKFLTIGGILATGFIIILIVNFLIGRVYCSSVCPLGIMQDIIAFFSKKFNRKKFRFKYSKPKNLIRYGILSLVVLLALFGSLTLVDILDPYSVFGRFASDFVKPIYIGGNNLVAHMFEQMHVYAMYIVDHKKVSLVASIIPIIFLITIVRLAFNKGRLYCNTICPVGTFLGLISKISIFKLKIEDSSCTQCGQCAFACKSTCINIKTKELDFSRCVSCYNCVNVCSTKSVKYKLAWVPNKSKEAKPIMDSSKRDFFAKSLLISAGAMGATQLVKAAGNTAKKLKAYKKKHLVNPPGSISADHYNNACTACHLCVSACPSGVLQPRFFESGISGLLQPYMDQSTSFCNFECTRCGNVCPTGAIKALNVEEKKVMQVGVVKFIRENCVVYTNNTSCGSCSEHCPTQAVRMVPYKGKLTIPEIDQEICIGCGACEHACPVRPYRSIYVEGNPIQKNAKKPVIKKIEEEQTEEFPF